MCRYMKWRRQNYINIRILFYFENLFLVKLYLSKKTKD